MDLSLLKRRSEFEWWIEPRGKMRVPGILFASEPLVRAMDHKVFEQVTNVATLPGIREASMNSTSPPVGVHARPMETPGFFVRSSTSSSRNRGAPSRSMTSAGVTVELTLTDTHSGRAIWSRTLDSDVSRYATMYHSVMIYGRGGAFSFNLLPPPSDAKVDRHSIFSWHFEALRRGMLDARTVLAATLAKAE